MDLEHEKKLYLDYMAGALLMPYISVLERLEEQKYWSVSRKKKIRIAEKIAEEYGVDLWLALKRIREVTLLKEHDGFMAELVGKEDRTESPTASDKEVVRITDEHLFSQEEVVDLFDSVGWSEFTSDYPERLMDSLENGDKVFTAWADGELVGLLSTMCNTFHAHIVFLCVKPEHQNKGIGTRLLQQFQSHYSNHRHSTTTHTAQKLYEKEGFEVTGVSMMHWAVTDTPREKEEVK